MQAKLFVTDMDGTLLNNEHKISKGNKHMIKRAVGAGVIFTIATGRMYAWRKQPLVPFHSHAEEGGTHFPARHGCPCRTIAKYARRRCNCRRIHRFFSGVRFTP